MFGLIHIISDKVDSMVCFRASFLIGIIVAIAASALSVSDIAKKGKPCFKVSWNDAVGKERTASIYKETIAGGCPRLTWYIGSTLVTVYNSGTGWDGANSGFGSAVHHGPTTHPGGTISIRYHDSTGVCIGQ
jgi:hypothetical protein